MSLFLECLIIDYLGICWFLIFSSWVRCSLLFARIASDVMPWERFVDRSIWLVSWLLVLLLLEPPPRDKQTASQLARADRQASKAMKS